ncbi:MAG: hypothetical protein U0232_00590 [Thermomicrobiales bacterium]
MYALSVSKQGSGTISPGSGSYASGTPGSLAAAPAAGSSRSGAWTGAT